MKAVMQKFIDFFKPIYVTAFLILVIEMFQLLLGINYYRYYFGYTEGLKMAGIFLFLMLLVASVLAGIFIMVTGLLRHTRYGEGYLKAGMEVACTAIFGLAYLPALILVATKDYIGTMRSFWTWKMGLIPLVIITIIILLRIRFKQGFKRSFYNAVDALWYPFLAISLGMFVWITVNLFTYSATDYSRPSELAQLSKRDGVDQSRPNIILITFDALSARNMSLYGYQRNTTPFWEELAKESFVFERMYANYNTTPPSLISILTSKYPWTHGVHRIGHYLKEKNEENIMNLLPEYYSAAIVSTSYAYPAFIGLGGQFDYAQWADLEFPRILDSIDYLLRQVINNSMPPLALPILRHILYLNLNAGDYRDYYAQNFGDAVSFLLGLKQRPFFLWLHIWPPHAPYDLPSPFRGQFLPKDEVYDTVAFGQYEESQQLDVNKMMARYDENILLTDASLKLFFYYLKELNLYDSSIIIVLSDHGELFERGWVQHSSPYLFEPEIHIPLLVHLPGQSQGRRIYALAEQVDIAPTILDLLGKPVPSWTEGESLVPYMEGKFSESKKTKFSMVFSSFFHNKYHRAKTIAALSGNYKVIYDMITNTAKLYNIKEDKQGLKDLAYSHPDILFQLKQKIIDRTGK